uniref:Uncharacterized protein n=1 Tax=uncultured marine thaumarchaeote AD1000_24_H07 TaxID=1455902 RepID=A0A075FSI7_9ARCH|nr:hypothetical protein [uncultured marine thaumarchaeote AD1000_24_H07]
MLLSYSFPPTKLADVLPKHNIDGLIHTNSSIHRSIDSKADDCVSIFVSLFGFINLDVYMAISGGAIAYNSGSNTASSIVGIIPNLAFVPYILDPYFSIFISVTVFIISHVL